MRKRKINEGKDKCGFWGFFFATVQYNTAVPMQDLNVQKKTIALDGTKGTGKQ